MILLFRCIIAVFISTWDSLEISLHNILKSWV